MRPLSPLTRDLLIEHIPGPVPLGVDLNKTFEDRRKRCRRAQTIRNAMVWGWLEYDRRVAPQFTRLTAEGRRVLSAAIAEWADCLRRAGFRFEAPPCSTFPAAVDPAEPPLCG